MAAVEEHHHCTYQHEAAALNRLLFAIRRTGQRRAVLAGAAWTAGLLIALLSLLVGIMGWWGGDAMRVAGWILLSVVGTAAVVLQIAWPLRRLNRPEAVALRIGAVYPRLASDVLSASQLARAETPLRFSPFMIEAHLRTIRLDLEARLKDDRVFPKHRLVLPALVLLLAMTGAVAAFVTTPQIMAMGFSSLMTEQTPPSRKYQRIAAKAPVVGDLTVSLRYPEYLDRPDRTLSNVSGGFVAPIGTTVIIEGRALVPDPEKGEIFLPDGGRSPLSIDAQGAVRGSFVVAGAGPFYIALGNAAVMMEGPSRTIETETDGLPAIRLLRPTGKVSLSTNDELLLDLEAEDDHALSRIDVVIRIGEETELRKTIVRFADKVKRIKTRYRWTPDSIRIGEETRINLELEAFDNDTILGPKPGRTEPLEIRFLTAHSRHLNALEEQNETLDKLIDLLAYRIETAVPGSKQADEARSRFAIVRGQTEDLLAKTAALVGVLNQDDLTPKRVVDSVVQIRQDISNQLMYEARLYEGETLGDFKQRLGVDRVTRRLLERAVIRMDDLIIDQQLSRVVHTGSRLQASRTEISRLLGRYLETRSESVRRSLLDAISAMEKEVSRLEKHLSQVRGKVGDAYLNAAALVHMDLLGTLSQLKKLLAADDVSDAVQLVTRMEMDLARLLAGLEGGLLSFRTERFGEGERFIGELLDRLLGIESGQLQVRRETIALKRSYQERLNDVMRGKINPLVKKQLKRVDRIRKLVDKLNAAVDSPPASLLERLREVASELSLALRQGDLDEARQVSEEIADVADELLAGLSGRPVPALSQIEAEAQALVRDVQDAYPRPSRLLPEKDARASRAEAMNQRALVAKTRKLKAWIGRQSEETRFLSTRALDALTQVVRRMSRSAAELEAKAIGEALQEQSAVLDELARLREDLKRGDEVAPLESRPVVLTGRVSLPDPDEFEVPPEFRDDILEAMRGELPNQYEEAIRRYYERLVK